MLIDGICSMLYFHVLGFCSKKKHFLLVILCLGYLFAAFEFFWGKMEAFI